MNCFTLTSGKIFVLNILEQFESHGVFSNTFFNIQLFFCINDWPASDAFYWMLMEVLHKQSKKTKQSVFLLILVCLSVCQFV